MAFEAKEQTIDNIFTKSIFIIPRNQRRFVWNKENWQDLMEDLLFSIEEQKPHFIGSIVLEEIEKKGGLDYYKVIDGQQRIITITLLLIALMKLFKENALMDAAAGTVQYLVSKDNNNHDEIVLQSDYHLSIPKYVDSIVKGDGTALSINAFVKCNQLSAKDKNIGDAIQFFYSFIKDVGSKEDKPYFLRNIRDALLEMVAVKIISRNQDDSYTIFEILNARGQDLKDHELLKNYVMRHIRPTNRRVEAKAKWEDMESQLGGSLDKYINHYCTHKIGDYKDKYKTAYNAIKKTTKAGDVGALFDDITQKAIYYKRIIDAKSLNDGSLTEKEQYIYDFFRRKKFEQFRPILISLLHQKDLERINQKQYENLLDYLYAFFICYIIIGEERSNTLQYLARRYAKSFEENCNDESIKELISELKTKLPSYEMFKNAFLNIGFSNHSGPYIGDRNKNRAKTVIELIEVKQSPTGNCADFTIEHIDADSKDVKNARIGNLIPLERKLNESLKDMDAIDKVDTYYKSAFSTTRNMAKRIEEKGHNTEERTEYLAKFLYYEVLQMNLK